ncbi:hypothetical protein K439DRAFT_1389708, partial [Ramaria rubella]
MTIHKCQGQTLPDIVVDLTNVWSPGHVYSALSRAVDFDRLQIIGFQAHKV